LSSAGKKTAQFLLAVACDSYASCVHCVAMNGTPLYLFIAIVLSFETWRLFTFCSFFGFWFFLLSQHVRAICSLRFLICSFYLLYNAVYCNVMWIVFVKKSNVTDRKWV